MNSTYETCGQLNLENLTATAFTYLPNIANAKYRYIEFYNISNDRQFGVFGVMVDNLGNYDLRRRLEPLTPIAVTPVLDLEFINSKYSTRLLTEITEDDDVYFFCWHDNAFDPKILQHFKDDKLSMEAILALLKSGLVEFHDLEEATTFYLKQPKIGNGGILTVEGSC